MWTRMTTRALCTLIVFSAQAAQAEDIKPVTPATDTPPVTTPAPAAATPAPPPTTPTAPIKTEPAPAAKVEQPAPTQKKKRDRRLSPELEKSCNELLSAMKASSPDAVVSAALIEEKRQLELSIAEALAKQSSLTSETQVQDMQLFERALALLARGNADELVALIKPLQRAIFDAAKTIQMSTKEIERLKGLDIEANRAEIAQHEMIYQRASVPFGENYGQYVMLASLIESVAEGQGVGDRSMIPLQHRAGAENAMMFDLDSQTAITAAKRIRGILNPAVERQWVPNLATDSYAPQLEELRTMFRGNIYALLAKLRLDLKKEQLDQRWWVKGLRYVADTYMNATATTWFPERYRKWVLKLTGIAYDQAMLGRYLDKIQAIVDVARVRTEAGEVVLSTDKATIDLQIKTLLEFDSQAIGDDLLITFARIGYHTDTWANIMTALKNRTLIDPKTGMDVNSPYTLLYNRMVGAQKRAADLGGLTYIYEPVIAYKAIFATMQIGYLLVTEEGVRNFVLPYIEHLLHFLN